MSFTYYVLTPIIRIPLPPAVTAAAAAPDDEPEITPANAPVASLLIPLRFGLFGSVLFADVLDAHRELGTGMGGDRFSFWLFSHLYGVWRSVGLKETEFRGRRFIAGVLDPGT